MASHSEARLARLACGAALLVLASCGGQVVVEPCDAAAGHPMDAGQEADAEPDTVFPDVVVPDVSIDASGAGCVADTDCEGAETCQSGVCCAGLFHEGVCFCGLGAGCDLFHVCCATLASPDEPVCAENATECCGAVGTMCAP